jgi:hypothetical protein
MPVQAAFCMINLILYDIALIDFFCVDSSCKNYFFFSIYISKVYSLIHLEYKRIPNKANPPIAVNEIDN